MMSVLGGWRDEDVGGRVGITLQQRLGGSRRERGTMINKAGR
jgi:hypothetical protein